MLDELYNNPSLIIAIVVFLICVIIGFVGDLYLKKIKKEEETNKRKENTLKAKEENIETLDTEPVIDATETLTNETPVFQTEAVSSNDIYNVDNFNAAAVESYVQPAEQNYNNSDYNSQVVYDNPVAEPVVDNVYVSNPMVDENDSYQNLTNDYTNNEQILEPVSFEQPAQDYNMYNVSTEEIDEQPVMPTNINSDYNVSMTYENDLTQDIDNYDVSGFEPVNNVALDIENTNTIDNNMYDEIATDFVNPVAGYETESQNFDETRILEPLNDYEVETPVVNEYNQNNDFADNTSNDNLNDNLF